MKKLNHHKHNDTVDDMKRRVALLLSNKPYNRLKSDRGLYAEYFRDWFNNFLTVERFAEYYRMSKASANRVLEAGRIIHEKEAKGEL